MSVRRSRRACETMVTLALVTITLATAGTAGAAKPPIKLVLTSHIGWQVNKTTKGTICLVATEECQQGTVSSQPGGFEWPEGVAGGAPGGDVYVADRGNSRVQELTVGGEFVLVFGREVDKTKTNEFKEAGNPHGIVEAEENLCTKASGDTCGAGKEGVGAEWFKQAAGVAVDPASGNVYVLDKSNYRIDEYTATGHFVLTFGKGVNRKGGDVCTAGETGECQGGAQAAVESKEHGAFGFRIGAETNVMTVGGGQHLVYVADEHRVQKFTEAGAWSGEFELPPTLTAPLEGISGIVVDRATEVAYVVYQRRPVVHAINAKGEEETTKNIVVAPRQVGERLEIPALAIDDAGRLALWMIEGESSVGTQPKLTGALYDVNNGQRLTTFQTPPFLYTATEQFQVPAMTFNGAAEQELYAAQLDNREVWRYVPKPVAELVNGAPKCVVGGEVDTDVTFNCDLQGTVDPWGVAGTEVWFQWGRSEALGHETPPQEVKNAKEPPTEGEEEPPVPVSTSIDEVRPNESGFYYRLVGRDRNAPTPELLESYPSESFTTPMVRPRIVGEPSGLFVKATSAVLFGEVNPENAPTQYWFEYGPVAALEECASGSRMAPCPDVLSAGSASSSLYGRIGASAEATGLSPNTTYGVRLVATDRAGESIGPISTFTTAGSPEPSAQTNPAVAVSATGAVISGTIDSGGPGAAYAFELGVDEGAATQYGTVFSGSVEAGSERVVESQQVSGLQPATKYAYRIKVTNGYGQAAGAPLTFTTQGLPTALTVPSVMQMLPTPPIAFPGPPKLVKRTKCKRGYVRDRRNRCVRGKAKKRGTRGPTRHGRRTSGKGARAKKR